MGQPNNVSVINLVSSNTIEHRMLDVLRFKTSMFKGVLDQGDDAIFMSESRFNKFMKSVDEMTNQTATEHDNSSTISAEEAHEQEDEKAMPQAGVMKQEALEEDDVDSPAPQEEQEREEPSASSSEPSQGQQTTTSGRGSTGETSPQQLVGQGISFLSQLGKTLKDPKATQELVSAITEKDEKTGQTYLKIPVEDQETVNNALQVLGSLFGAMGK